MKHLSLIEGHSTPADAVPDQKIRHIAVFQGTDPFFPAGDRPEGPRDFRAGAVAIGVDDPVPAVTAFPSQCQGPIRVPVELRSVMEQIQHRLRTFRHYDLCHLFIGQAGSGHQGILVMEGWIIVLPQGCSNASLGFSGIAVLELIPDRH